MPGIDRGIPGDQRAVGPVIGVVLLVAIVTVLAAAVGAFVTGFGDETKDPAPQFATSVEYNRSPAVGGQILEITHASGDRLATADAHLVVTGAASVSKSNPNDRRAVALEPSASVESQVGTHLTASETIRIDETAFEERATGSPIGPNRYLDLSDAVVRLVWHPGSEQSRTILKWEHEA
ncbi:type IV pilin N-terminal domain-containing protein [Haloarculaceae archaeon H-GB2-1]|nr:type IV pilin N-terminal domain-containing protein [Haloarculaceae archaeon H-GB1-1]MEA5388307.1 type IV pilin N-terminal domain-containing protein [Haloarculaceae archaeon H-GB11]MEA5406353.1 type IV pilin N-terminal domain-containing protein [Haloarculaceae archaeon H-GB2-1]